MKTSGKRSGSVLLEFSLTGVPLLMIGFSLMQMSIAMWQFYTLQHSIQSVCRYVSLHGRGCATNGNTCSLTVGGVATMIAGQALALDPSKLNVKLITASGTQTCNPVNSCNSNTNPFPPSSDNAAGQDVSITATYMVNDPIMMFWPGSAEPRGSNFTLGGKTRQRIQF